VLDTIRRDRGVSFSSIGFIGRGPKIAVCDTCSAAARYFSISTGGSDSTAPIVSKP
jgi:hypothetical protein